VIFIGIDWSEEHHEVEVQSGAGKQLKKLRVGTGVEGLSKLQETITSLADEPSQVVIAIESNHGLLVNALVASGYLVYAINPLTSARTREGESLARSKSDHGDARMLANLVRTKRQNLRPLAGDSEQAQAIRIRARSHVRAIRMQQRLRNQLRSALLNFYPGALPLLGEDEDLRDALAVLSVAPNPQRGRRLSLNQLAASLGRHGRQRNLAAKAAQIQAWLRTPQLELSSALLASAYADEVSFLVRTLLQVRREVAQLEQQLAADFRGHPDAEIYLSLPGLADILGARVLGESGDDPTRYANAKARKNYFGNSPITQASGKRRHVSRRIARNRLLADAACRWANSALSASPGARRYYDQLVARNHGHQEALRQLANRLTGILHGCLRHHRLYDESLAWTTPTEEAAA
jgi:Transposase/Transposase IS116/IS110/IS902 family